MMENFRKIVENDRKNTENDRNFPKNTGNDQNFPKFRCFSEIFRKKRNFPKFLENFDRFRSRSILEQNFFGKFWSLKFFFRFDFRFVSVWKQTEIYPRPNFRTFLILTIENQNFAKWLRLQIKSNQKRLKFLENFWNFRKLHLFSIFFVEFW